MFQVIYWGESGGSAAGSNPSGRVVSYEIGTKRGSRHLPIRPSINWQPADLGGRRYGASAEIGQTVNTENSASAPGLGTVQNRGSQFLPAASSQKSYGHAIDEFIGWYCSEPRLAFSRTVVLRYRFFLEQNNLAPSTINVGLAAVRRLAYEAADTGL